MDEACDIFVVRLQGVHQMSFRRLRWTWLLALSLPLAALAQMSAKQIELLQQTDAWQRAVASKMESIGTADSLTAAALLLPATLPAAGSNTSAHNDQAGDGGYQAALQQSAGARLPMLERAAALAPDAADIAALILRVCAQATDCDVAAHAQKLHRAAPEDAGYLLPALIEAEKGPNDGEVKRVLQAMAEAISLNSYYVDIQRRLQHATEQSSDWPEVPSSGNDDPSNLSNELVVVAVGIANMYAGPDLRGVAAINKACKESGPHFANRREDCRSIGILLSHDESLLSARLGLAFWRRTARDAVDLAAARQASRVLDWRMETYSRAMLDGTINAPSSLRATLDSGGEVPGVLALLKQHDLPTLPPEGWVSPREKTEQAKPGTHPPSTAAQ